MTAIRSFKGEFHFLSNFSHAPLRVLGIPFLNSEAAYMACKTDDIDIRKTFSNLQPGDAKKTRT